MWSHAFETLQRTKNFKSFLLDVLIISSTCAKALNIFTMHFSLSKRLAEKGNFLSFSHFSLSFRNDFKITMKNAGFRSLINHKLVYCPPAPIKCMYIMLMILFRVRNNFSGRLIFLAHSTIKQLSWQ